MTTNLASSPDVAPPSSSAIAPWRPWAEGAAGLLVAWLVTQRLGLHLQGIDFYSVIVVLIAARYGYLLGIGVGAVAATLTLGAAGLGLQSFFSVFSDRSHLALAFTYVALGALIGLVGDWPRAVAQRAQDELVRIRENYSQMEKRYKVLLDAKEAVDRRIVGQAHTIASLYEAARELESLVPAQVPPAMLRLLARFLEAEAAAVYLFEGEKLVLAAGLGERGDRPEILDSAHPLYAVASRQAPLSAATRAEYTRAGAHLAAPLLNADGRPRGVVAIEKLPFRQLTTATDQMLGLLADWASRSLAKSEIYQQAQELQRDHPITGIHRSNHMNDRIFQEWGAAKRYQLPLSAILVRCEDLADAEPSAWEIGAKAVTSLLQARLRTVDVLGHYRTRDSFLVLLPVTPLEGARILAGRLQESLPEARIALGSNQQGHADAEAMLKTMQADAFPEALQGDRAYA